MENLLNLTYKVSAKHKSTNKSRLKDKLWKIFKIKKTPIIQRFKLKEIIENSIVESVSKL